MKPRRRTESAKNKPPAPRPGGPPIICPYIITVDTREKLEQQFANVVDRVTGSRIVITTERATIPAGDYSIRFHSPPITVDWHDRVAVERKSMADLFNSFMGGHREREERKLAKLNALQFAAYVVEGTVADLLAFRCRQMPETTDQARRAEMMLNAIYKFQTVQFPRVHWVFVPADRAEEATWRLLDWFYKSSQRK